VTVETDGAEVVAVVSIIADETEPVTTIDMSTIAVEKKGKEEVAE